MIHVTAPVGKLWLSLVGVFTLLAVGEWWALWGSTVLWGAGAVAATLVSLYKFQRQLDQQFLRLDHRLYRIEVELGLRRERRHLRRQDSDQESSAS